MPIRVNVAEVCDAPIFIGITLRLTRDDDSSNTADTPIIFLKV